MESFLLNLTFVNIESSHLFWFSFSEKPSFFFQRALRDLSYHLISGPCSCFKGVWIYILTTFMLVPERTECSVGLKRVKIVHLYSKWGPLGLVYSGMMLNRQFVTMHFMVLDGNSERVAHAWWKIGIFGEENPICDNSHSNQMPETDQIIGLLLSCFQSNIMILMYLHIDLLLI